MKDAFGVDRPDLFSKYTKKQRQQQRVAGGMIVTGGGGLAGGTVVHAVGAGRAPAAKKKMATGLTNIQHTNLPAHDVPSGEPFKPGSVEGDILGSHMRNVKDITSGAKSYKRAMALQRGGKIGAVSGAGLMLGGSALASHSTKPPPRRPRRR